MDWFFKPVLLDQPYVLFWRVAEMWAIATVVGVFVTWRW